MFSIQINKTNYFYASNSEIDSIVYPHEKKSRKQNRYLRISCWQFGNVIGDRFEELIHVYYKVCGLNDSLRSAWSLPSNWFHFVFAYTHVARITYTARNVHMSIDTQYTGTNSGDTLSLNVVQAREFAIRQTFAKFNANTLREVEPPREFGWKGATAAWRENDGEASVVFLQVHSISSCLIPQFIPFYTSYIFNVYICPYITEH